MFCSNQAASLSVTGGEESSHSSLSRLAKSVTLWEFLKLKVGQRRTETEFAEMLTEFESLLHQMRTSVEEQLVPLANNDISRASASNIIVVCIATDIGLLIIVRPMLAKFNYFDLSLLYLERD